MSLIVIPLGLLIGLALGALGGGGSILTVPALVYLLGQKPTDATTSSLVIVGTTSMLALIPHAREGRVRWGQGLAFGVLGTGGSLLGSALASHVDPHVLLTAFAALMLIVATLMLRRARRTSPPEGSTADGGPPAEAPRMTLSPRTWARAQVAKVVGTATAVGLLTGFFGVGGGFVLVPALVLALSFPMPVAVGTSLLVIAVNSATALFARISSGGMQLDWPLIGGFTAAAVVGSLFGGRLASRLDPQLLTRAFGALLVAVALYTAARSVPALF